jgi:hypothetical protein
VSHVLRAPDLVSSKRLPRATDHVSLHGDILLLHASTLLRVDAWAQTGVLGSFLAVP